MIHEKNSIMVKELDQPVRGCGYRVEGGLYFYSNEEPVASGAFPMPVICDCCHNGIAPSRNLKLAKLARFAKGLCIDAPDPRVPESMLLDEDQSVVIITIGNKFYPTPEDYLKEALIAGFSRRINAIPRGWKLGDWVFLLHPKVFPIVNKKTGKPCFNPGIIGAFRPKEVQYVTNGAESSAQLTALEKRGITPVKINYI